MTSCVDEFLARAESCVGGTVTRLAVVAYPVLADDDRRWIERARALYDPQASRIAAHFTLVFPTEAAEVDVLAHTRGVVASNEPMAVVLRRAVAFPDPMSGGAFVCLLADDGGRELRVLHETLYDGVLATHRRRDAPFRPHVTIGADARLDGCERIAGELNAERRIMNARIETIDVIEVGDAVVRTVAQLRLGLGAPRGKGDSGW